MKYLLTLFFLAQFSLCFAQPVLDSTWLPQAGDKYYIYTDSDLGYGEEYEGKYDTGLNVTWDFSDIDPLDILSDSFDFVYPSTRGITCSHPHANFAHGDTLHGFDCYIRNDAGLYLSGWKWKLPPANITDSRHYTKPYVFFNTSFHFRDSLIDSAEFYYYSTPGPDSTTKVITYIQRVYDGFGTLELPDSTYNNVCRIKQVSYSIDSQYVDTAYQYNYSGNETYFWYVPGHNVWLFKVNNAYALNSSKDTTQKGSGALMTIEVSSNPGSFLVPSPPPGMEGYFNDGQLYILGTALGQINYKLYDAQGKLVQSGNAGMQGGSAKAPVAELSNGVYILQVQDEKGQVYRTKLIKR